MADGFIPPQGVQSNARRGLELRREFNRGGTDGANGTANLGGGGGGKLYNAGNGGNGGSSMKDAIDRIEKRLGTSNEFTQN